MSLSLKDDVMKAVKESQQGRNDLIKNSCNNIKFVLLQDTHVSTIDTELNSWKKKHPNCQIISVDPYLGRYNVEKVLVTYVKDD